MSRSFELLEHPEPRDGWITIRCAVDGKLCVPFQVHRSDRERYRDDESYFQMLERQASSLLETYGDVRTQRLTEEVA